MATAYVQRGAPSAVHVVTAQDPRDAHDWWIEFKYLPLKKKLSFIPSLWFEMNPTIVSAVRRADCVFTQAKFAASKAKKLYGLDYEPAFLPNPVAVPDDLPPKAARPTVVFLARWDRRKRVEIFFELARQFPSVHFIALGKAHDTGYDLRLRQTYGNLPNLEMPGFIDQFSGGDLGKYLGPAWIMINTAARECLPVAYLEAAAHRCAILSFVNPDNFATGFGYHAADEDFARGLSWLLTEDRWRQRGELGQEYVRQNHQLGKAVDMHLNVYHSLLEKRK